MRIFFEVLLDLGVVLAFYAIGYVRGWSTGVRETEVRWSEAVGRKEAQ